jgi:hypothetical protein
MLISDERSCGGNVVAGISGYPRPSHPKDNAAYSRTAEATHSNIGPISLKRAIDSPGSHARERAVHLPCANANLAKTVAS